MIYRNRMTGAIVETRCFVAGGNWEEYVPPKKPEVEKEEEAEASGKPPKKRK